MARAVLKPKALIPGDTIGIISPSWFGGASFIPRARRGIAMLESLGYNVRIGEHAFNNHGSVSDSAHNRVLDLHSMFADDAVSAVLCTIGGDHSCHLLPLLDWSLIASHPKVFLGFSDITVLNIAIHTQTGLVTFNGPTLLTDWAEYPSMPEISKVSALRLLTRPVPFGALTPTPKWTDEFLDWETGEDTRRRRKHHQGEGWRWIRSGEATGTLIGGCLESLQHLRGTCFWPDLGGAILFVDTSEECRSPDAADAILMDYQNMGVFNEIAALLVARPYGMEPAARERFWHVIEERTEGFAFPVVGNLDFGHTTPLLTLPIGVRARVDGARGTIKILESAVTER
jgi:muramoyltetrapeptide carboxypeptidase